MNKERLYERKRKTKERKVKEKKEKKEAVKWSKIEGDCHIVGSHTNKI